MHVTENDQEYNSGWQGNYGKELRMLENRLCPAAPD